MEETRAFVQKQQEQAFRERHEEIHRRLTRVLHKLEGMQKSLPPPKQEAFPAWVAPALVAAAAILFFLTV